MEWQFQDNPVAAKYRLGVVLEFIFLRSLLFIIVNFIIRETNGEKHFDQTLFGFTN